MSTKLVKLLQNRAPKHEITPFVPGGLPNIVKTMIKDTTHEDIIRIRKSAPINEPSIK